MGLLLALISGTPATASLGLAGVEGADVFAAVAEREATPETVIPAPYGAGGFGAWSNEPSIWLTDREYDEAAKAQEAAVIAPKRRKASPIPKWVPVLVPVSHVRELIPTLSPAAKRQRVEALKKRRNEDAMRILLLVS